MAKAPAFQFYANDFMDATSTWEANAVGLYVRCLCKQWTHGSIPSDLRILARAIHCDRSELESAWPVLKTKFDDQGDGTLKNNRLEQVRDRQNVISEARSRAGKIGANAKANASANTTAKAKQRKVKEKTEGEDGEGGNGGGVGEPSRKGPDPGVQGVIEHLTAALKIEGIAQSLDGSEKDNRYAAKSLLDKLAKDYPEYDALECAKHLINAVVKDEFHRKNATSVRYLFNNCGKITAAARARKADHKNQTTQDRDQQLADVLQQRAAARSQHS